MRIFLLAGTALLGVMTVAGAGAQAPDTQGNGAQNGAAPDAETQRLNQAASERLRQQMEARQRVIDQNAAHRRQEDEENARHQREYQEQMRARNAAIAAEQARYDAEMARFNAQRAESERQNASRGGRAVNRGRASAERTSPPAATGRTSTASAAGRSCADQVRRARGRGRAIGGVVGGVAGIVGGRNLGTVARVGVAALSAPVGALIGDAIASRLDCREQEQAALATEQAVEGGVGTTVSWRSDTRGGVSGTSTVTAIEAGPAPTTPAAMPVATSAGTPAATPGSAPAATASVETSPCLTVTDVIIVDGEETRAAKRMCRRPPSNRFVRV